MNTVKINNGLMDPHGLSIPLHKSNVGLEWTLNLAML